MAKTLENPVTVETPLETVEPPLEMVEPQLEIVETPLEIVETPLETPKKKGRPAGAKSGGEPYTTAISLLQWPMSMC